MCQVFTKIVTNLNEKSVRFDAGILRFGFLT